MGKKLILKTDQNEPGEQTVTEMLLQSEEPDFDEQIRQIAQAEGMDDGRASISRRPPGRPAHVYCGEMALGDFSLEQCRRLWGGGDYRVRFRKANGEYAGHKSFVIDHDSKPDAQAVIASQRDNQRSDDSLATAVVGKVMDKLAPEKGEQQNVLLEMMKMQREQANQFLTLMLKSQSDMVTAMANLAAAASKPAAVAPAPGLDMLTALQVFDKLKGKDFDVIALFRLVKEMAEESGGKQPESWVEKLMPLVPMLLNGGQPPPGQPGQPGQPGALPSGQPQRALPAPPGSVVTGMPTMTARPAPVPIAGPTMNGGATVATPDGVANPTLPANPSTPEEMKQLIVLIIRQKLPQLKLYAANGADPYDVSALVSNPLAVPRDQFFQLCELLEKETWLDDIFGGEPAIAPFKVWFEALRKAILEDRDEILNPEPEGKAE